MPLKRSVTRFYKTCVNIQKRAVSRLERNTGPFMMILFCYVLVGVHGSMREEKRGIPGLGGMIPLAHVPLWGMYATLIDDALLLI